MRKQKINKYTITKGKYSGTIVYIGDEKFVDSNGNQYYGLDITK